MVADHEARIDLGINGLAPAEHIGRGGFADVYRAEQLTLRRTVAVKVLRAQANDPRTGSRLAEECRAIGAVSDHPHLVGVHEGGLTRNGRAYVVMEYLPGGSLRDRLERGGPLLDREVIELGIKIGGALAVAHRAGVLHCDIKPANIMISAYGEPALGDFGIARIEGGPKTLTGLVTASFAHAAPELFEGHDPTPASDIYSLASTMFELLVGCAPYYDPTDESVWPLMKRILSKPMPDPASVGMSQSFGAVFERATARDLADRYDDVEQFVEGLAAVAGDPAGVVVHRADPALSAALPPVAAAVDRAMGGAGPSEPGRPPEDPAPVSLPTPAPDLTSWPGHDTELRWGRGPLVAGHDDEAPAGRPSEHDDTAELPTQHHAPAELQAPATRITTGHRVPRWGWAAVAVGALVLVAWMVGGRWMAGDGGEARVLPETAVRAEGSIESAPTGELVDTADIIGGEAADGVGVELVLDGASTGPLTAGAPVTTTISGVPDSALLRYVVDGQVQGEPTGDLAPYVPAAGRQAVAVEATTGDGVTTSEPVQVYAVDPAAGDGLRANLASIPAEADRWETALETYDRMVAAGHDRVQLRSSDDFPELVPGYWNIFVPGFGQDAEAAEQYCERFGLSIPEECFVSDVDTSG